MFLKILQHLKENTCVEVIETFLVFTAIDYQIL